MGPLKLLRRLLLLGLILLVIALVVIDNLARVGSQDAIGSAVKASTRSQSASAKISSFPFIYDAAAEGKLGKIVVTDRGVPIGALRLDVVTLNASDVRFDRHQLFVDHKVRITEIDRATLTMETHLSALVSSLANAAGAQVTAPSPGIIAITVGGQVVSSINLTQIPIVPACPLQITHTGDDYTFTCTVSPVPPSVLAALSKFRPKV